MDEIDLAGGLLVYGGGPDRWTGGGETRDGTGKSGIANVGRGFFNLDLLPIADAKLTNLKLSGFFEGRENLSSGREGSEPSEVGDFGVKGRMRFENHWLAGDIREWRGVFLN